jgi:hypothetical protein
VLGPSTLRRQSFDLVFDVARYLGLMRPERFVRFALPSVEALATAVRAVLLLHGSVTPGASGGGATATAGATADVERLAAYMQAKLPAAARGPLAELTHRLVAAAGAEPPDVERWIRAADLSAARAALLMCGDIRAASRVMAADPVGTSPLSAEQRVHALTVFSVSPAYFACRRHLGLQVAG